KIKEAAQRLAEAGIKVSLFIDADAEQIEAAKHCGVPAIEIHTGHYADADNPDARQNELKKIVRATELGHELGLQVNAGHGLNYQNTRDIAAIRSIRELNIGHAIIAEAVFIGLPAAVRKMKEIMKDARIAV
ncbi:MAG: pyridoxine 5'-phosphate synthase, partial [Gammaproteobacteria bacterium]|nr:pyridoxine 5'-phosphate synthase [Gammaproteobacteria bacterium]